MIEIRREVSLICFSIDSEINKELIIGILEKVFVARVRNAVRFTIGPFYQIVVRAPFGEQVSDQ